VLLGGVIDSKYSGYDLVQQWTSYGWNVFEVEDGGDYGQIVEAYRVMEAVDPSDRRPIILIARTVKGYWPPPWMERFPVWQATDQLPKSSLRVENEF